MADLLPATPAPPPPPSSSSGTPIVSAETNVSMVTFFEDRAEVVRALRCHVPKGRSRVHAHGMTLLVDDRSLTCKPRGSAGVNVNVIFSRVRRRVEDVAHASAEEIRSMEVELEAARARIARADRGLASEAAEGRQLSAMIRQWSDSVMHVPSRAEAAIEQLNHAYDALDKATRESLDAFGTFRTAREEAQLELSRTTMRLDHARSKKPRFEAFTEIEITADAECDLEMEIIYRTPCALWRPEHLARLTRSANAADGMGTGEITVTTYASVWQLTGESWKDIPCRFSTARPARSATAPMLREDVLTTRKKTDMERKQVVVEAREQTIATAGIARGTRDVEEMPGVDDGGEAQWLTGRSHATIESDGRPVRVEVSQRVLPCTVARVCYPELSGSTHLRATATMSGPTPLLAGPVTIGRETEIVGRATTTFVGAGEPFELGFGIDDGLRVRRKAIEKRKTTPVTNTQHIAREICLYVSNLSGDARSLKVIERIPVSEVEDVVVELTERPAQLRHDTRDGFATFEVDVPPRSTRDLTLKYRIEARSNVVLPPLDV